MSTYKKICGLLAITVLCVSFSLLSEGENLTNLIEWITAHYPSELVEGVGIDVNQKTNRGMTLLMHAAQEEHENVAQWLLNEGADPNAQNDLGYTALMYAAEIGNNTIIKQLLDANADVYAQSEDGKTALMNAAKSGNIAALTQLLNAGADIDSPDNNGETALIIAALRGHKEIVKMLLEHGVHIPSVEQWEKIEQDWDTTDVQRVKKFITRYTPVAVQRARIAREYFEERHKLPSDIARFVEQIGIGTFPKKSTITVEHSEH